MHRIIHFEIHAADPDRAIRFYSALFGWKFQNWPGSPYWLIDTGEGPGINGGMMKRRGADPVDGQAVNAFVCVVQVASVDEHAARIPQAGGTMTVPKLPVPGIGWSAYARDPEGNLFCIFQEDPGAKG